MTVIQTEDFQDQTLGQPIDPALTIFTNQLQTITCVAGLAGTTKAANIIPAGTATGHFYKSGLTLPKVLVRGVFRASANPAADAVIMHAYDGDVATGIRIADVMWLTDGKLRIRSGFTTIATSTNALSLGTDYALEWLVDVSTHTQTLRIYSALTQIATPVEALTGGSAATATQVTQFQVGKMTATTWTGGIILDEFILADDFWATSVPDTFNEHFDGTLAAAITTNANINSVTGTAPVVAAGGVRTDLKVASFTAQSSANREIESKRFAVGTTTGYSRFYCKIPAKPASLSEALVFWQAKGPAGNAAFGLTAAPGFGSTVDIGLWRGTDWITYFDGATPLAFYGGLPVDTWFRVDVRVTDDGASNFTCRVDLYVGNAKHLTDATSRAARLNATGTAGGVRANWLCQTIASPGVNRVAVQFDEWRGSTVAAPGPIPLAEQSDTPVGQQWAAYEWDGPQGPGTLTPLNVVGAIQGDSTAGTLRVRKGKFQKNGADYIPHGFNLMAVSLPIGAGVGGEPGTDAWANWVAHSDAMMAALKNNWKVDTLRLQLGQAGIDPSGVNYSQAYVDQVVSVVSTLLDYGFICILSMQDWDPVAGEMHKVPSAHTQRAWQKLLPYVQAWTFDKRSAVACEIFNEPQLQNGGDSVVTPTANDWAQWRDGGSPTGTISTANNVGAPVVGHQQVLETIRATGFTGVVIADAPDLGHSLSGITPLTDTLANNNIGYAIHTQRFHYVNGNTSTQDRTNIWEPRWETPRDANNLAVISTEWSLRRMVNDGFTTGLKAATPDFLDWMQANGFGITPWAFDTATGDFAYVIAHSGGNAWVPNDWDAWDPITLPADTGAGELLYARYPTWSPVATEPLNIAATEVVGPAASLARVSGDPGVGKVLLGWNAGNNMQYIKDGRTWLRGLNPGAPYAPNAAIAPGVFKVFAYEMTWQKSQTSFMADPFGAHSDGTWKKLRNQAANADIIQWCIDLEDAASGDGTVSQYVQNMVDGFYDPWVKNTLAPGIKDCYERYGTAFHINWGNEPDAMGNSNFTSNLTNLKLARRACRRLHFFLLSEGVPRDAFEFSPGCLINQTSHFHHQRWVRPHQIDGPQSYQNASLNKHHLAHFCADWKEQDPTTIGWTDAWKPPPVAFIQPNETDPWGYGVGPITRVWPVDSYCEDAWGSSNQGVSLKTISLATMKSTHIFSHFIQDSWSSHAGGHQKFLTGAFGRQIPIVIGEWGYGIHDAEAAPDLPGTMELGQNYMEDFAANSVIGVVKWRQDWSVGANPPPHGAGSGYGPISFTRRAASGSTPGPSRDDPDDAYGKQLASMWSSPRAQLPKSKGTSVTSKPFDHA